ncbi:MAG: helix-turn-helix domain-containing protein [Bacillota bacterium]
MEKERIGINKKESWTFTHVVKKAKDGDKKSMEEILNFFKDDIEYLSRFILQPREEVIQALKTELINIVIQKL